MKRQYIHEELNKEIQSISGWYELQKEDRIEYDGKEFIYLVGSGVVDSSCCGVGGCIYAVVPGSIVSWKSGTNEDGLFISEVEPVADEKVKDDLRKILFQKEGVNQIQFW